MSAKEPLLEVVVDKCKAYPVPVVMAVTKAVPSAPTRRHVRQRVAARRCCRLNRCLFLIFVILIGSGIILRPKSLAPLITSSDIYFTNGTVSSEKTLDVWNPNYYSVKMTDPVLEQWFLNCDCNNSCEWDLFGKYKHDGSINIRSRTNKQITTTSTQGPTSEALRYYAKTCIGDNLFVKFTSSWNSGGRKWKWHGPEYRIDCG